MYENKIKSLNSEKENNHSDRFPNGQKNYKSVPVVNKNN